MMLHYAAFRRVARLRPCVSSARSCRVSQQELRNKHTTPGHGATGTLLPIPIELNARQAASVPALHESLRNIAAASGSVAWTAPQVLQLMQQIIAAVHSLGAAAQLVEATPPSQQLATLEQLVYIYGSAVYMARASGQVAVATERQRQYSLALQSGLRAVQELPQHASPSQHLTHHLQLQAVREASDLLLPLQYPLRFSGDTQGSSTHAAKKAPADDALDMRLPFFPCRFNLGSHTKAHQDVDRGGMAAAVQTYADQMAVVAPPADWREFVHRVELLTSRDTRGVADRVAARAGAESSSDHSGASALTRRKAISLLSLYRQADIAIAAWHLQAQHQQHPQQQALSATEAGSDGTAASNSGSATVLPPLISSLLVQASPADEPGTHLTYLRDRLRLLLRMASTASSATQQTTAHRKATHAVKPAPSLRPDSAMVMSVLRDCAAPVMHCPQHWRRVLASTQRQLAANNSVATALLRTLVQRSIDTCPADALVVQTAAELARHMRPPRPPTSLPTARTNVQVVVKGGGPVQSASPPASGNIQQLQYRAMSPLVQRALHRTQCAAAIMSFPWAQHVDPRTLSVPQLAMLDYVILRCADDVMITQLLAAALKCAGGTELQAAIERVTVDREGRRDNLLLSARSSRILDAALLQNIEDCVRACLTI